MAEPQPTKIYRITWEERRKPPCSKCCDDSNHPWAQRATDMPWGSTLSDVDREISKMDEGHRTMNIQVRYLKTWIADAPDWSETSL
jgi:hypothetical protein